MFQKIDGLCFEVEAFEIFQREHCQECPPFSANFFMQARDKLFTEPF